MVVERILKSRDVKSAKVHASAVKRKKLTDNKACTYTQGFRWDGLRMFKAVHGSSPQYVFQKGLSRCHGVSPPFCILFLAECLLVLAGTAGEGKDGASRDP